MLQSGFPTFDIVPRSDSLTIKVRVQPNNIDAMHAGQTARVSISVFCIAEDTILMGTVQAIFANALVDEQTGASFYLARIRLNDIS